MLGFAIAFELYFEIGTDSCLKEGFKVVFSKRLSLTLDNKFDKI